MSTFEHLKLSTVHCCRVVVAHFQFKSIFEANPELGAFVDEITHNDTEKNKKQNEIATEVVAIGSVNCLKNRHQSKNRSKGTQC